MQMKAASKLVPGPYSENVVRDVAMSLRHELNQAPTLGVVFASPDYLPHIEDFLELIRLNGYVPTLVGCSGGGLIGQTQELEGQSGFSLLLLSLPGCQAKTTLVSSQTIQDAYGGPAYWRNATGIAPQDARAWMVFADPFHFPVDNWLRQWNTAYPGVVTFGGLASGFAGQNEAVVFLNGKIVDGAVAVGLTGPLQVRAVVSQGCKPIGEPLTVTQAQQNVLLSLGSKPAYEVLSEVYEKLTSEEKMKARGHLFAGLAMNEYVEEFKRGDFLVRNIIGADPISGAVALNAQPRVGQTLQYQLRDDAAASEDLNQLLQAVANDSTIAPFAGILCSCNGRGKGLFKTPSHDARAITKYFPQLPLAGFFAYGEIGPVGAQNYIHGYTASLALFAPANE
jgi:small ligand-binding sensory domain FIST